MFQIRPCRIEDFNEVLELLHQLWPDKSLDTASLRIVYDRALVSDSQAYVCVTAGEKIIAFGSLTVKNNLWQAGYLGHVDELVVDKKYRSRGVGTQVLEQLIALAKQKGCCRIELDSASHRTDAHRFYERHGFENRGYLFSRVL